MWKWRGFFLPVILRIVAALAAFVHTGHILMYAPGASLTSRLAKTRMILAVRFIARVFPEPETL